MFTHGRENVKPEVEVRSKRVGGAAYQVPMQVNRNRQQSLAIRWILLAVREKKGRPTHEKLADELVAAYQSRRRGRHAPRQRAPHGRRQQGLRPLRLVMHAELRYNCRRTAAAFDSARYGVAYARVWLRQS